MDKWDSLDVLVKNEFLFTGLVFVSGDWARGNDTGGVGFEYSTFGQFPCISAEEELAECKIVAHKEYYGTTAASLLIPLNFVATTFVVLSSVSINI
ncbi:unnamed protein product [Gongylonema pulchrum]|uniref:Dirigent protein n=1 Tax=Gongylonema pulchrum TaxID=637853 RepID=A0A183CV36_9BILA|nr:unnamed protein product [Gongylonema pulchrum]